MQATFIIAVIVYKTEIAKAKLGFIRFNKPALMSQPLVS